MANFELSPELRERIVDLESDLRVETSALQEAFDGRSERWQETTQGSETGAWIERLWGVVDVLEEVTNTPE